MTLHPGAVGCFMAGSDVVQLAPSPGNSSVVLKFLSEPVFPLLWEYDLETRLPIRALSGSAASSRLEYVSALLGAMDSCSAIPTLSWVALDTGTTSYVGPRFARLRFWIPGQASAFFQFVPDPHPQVRRAARQALEMARSDDL